MKENLNLAYEIILLTEISKEKLMLKELLPLYFSLKAYSQNLESKDAVKFKSALLKISKLIKRERYLQKEKISLSNKYLKL